MGGSHQALLQMVVTRSTARSLRSEHKYIFQARSLRQKATHITSRSLSGRWLRTCSDLDDLTGTTGDASEESDDGSGEEPEVVEAEECQEDDDGDVPATTEGGRFWLPSWRWGWAPKTWTKLLDSVTPSLLARAVIESTLLPGASPTDKDRCWVPRGTSQRNVFRVKGIWFNSLDELNAWLASHTTLLATSFAKKVIQVPHTLGRGEVGAIPATSSPWRRARLIRAQ